MVAHAFPHFIIRIVQVALVRVLVTVVIQNLREWLQLDVSTGCGRYAVFNSLLDLLLDGFAA